MWDSKYSIWVYVLYGLWTSWKTKTVVPHLLEYNLKIPWFSQVLMKLMKANSQGLSLNLPLMNTALHLEFRNSYFLFIISLQSASVSYPIERVYINVVQVIGTLAENKSFMSFKISGKIESTCKIKNSCIQFNTDHWENHFNGWSSVKGWVGALVLIGFDCRI